MTLKFLLSKVGGSGEICKIVDDGGINERERMFRGSTQLNLDSKGRLAIPAKYRDELLGKCDGHIVVTADPSRCLVIYPQPVWAPIEAQLNKMFSLNEQVRRLQRLVIGNACEVEMDSSGRILIGPYLRQFAGLQKEVVLAGLGEKFELWDMEKWNQENEAATEFIEGEIPSELQGFSL
ncbi:transcriptional regulator MraZ [Nitrosomonas stercoris]|uniref:Transcriptional regulator MraZ n=1 Tax=Nitrosomonas stercoris TaxID=1444684 RepID=A0A4Y1YNY8_9PROT|nr:transcriptional regulator MraZ [Nitrosomonas stercoris]